MSLIKSISGIRGTIGGKPGEGLSPLDIVKFTAAYSTLIRKSFKTSFIKKKQNKFWARNTNHWSNQKTPNPLL